MKYFYVLLIFALTVCPGIGGRKRPYHTTPYPTALSAGTARDIHTILLTVLKPDLEYLRGYWLKNPGEKPRQGRIVLAKNSQILVNFEQAANAIDDDAWKGDYLLLKNIHELNPASDSFTAMDELFYRLTTFYVRSNPYALPESPDLADTVFIRTLPVGSGNNTRPSIEVRYIDLEALGKEIEREVSRIDSESTGDSSIVTVKICDSQFSFDYVKERMQLFIRHVRLIKCRRYEPQRYQGEEWTRSTLNFVKSTENPFIRYDRYTKSFYSAGNDKLDERSIVRSSVSNYILRDNTTAVSDCVEHTTTVSDFVVPIVSDVEDSGSTKESREESSASAE